MDRQTLHNQFLVFFSFVTTLLGVCWKTQRASPERILLTIIHCWRTILSFLPLSIFFSITRNFNSASADTLLNIVMYT